jgi:ribosome maturation factor RimP
MADDPVVALVRRLLDPLCAARGLSVYDVEHVGRSLRIAVDREGGIDLDTLAEVNHDLGQLLDEADPIANPYQLEVGSPGLERRLRTAQHWQGAIGQQVKVKLRPAPTDQLRRLDGVVESVEGESVSLSQDGNSVQFPISRVDRANTVFVWEKGDGRARSDTHSQVSETSNEGATP